MSDKPIRAGEHFVERYAQNDPFVQAMHAAEAEIRRICEEAHVEYQAFAAAWEAEHGRPWPNSIEDWEELCGFCGIPAERVLAGDWIPGYFLPYIQGVLKRLRTHDPPADDTGDKSRGGRPKKGRPTVNARMLDLITARPESKGWTAKQFSVAIECAESSVKDTKTWEQLADIRRLARAEKQIAKARRRR